MSSSEQSNPYALIDLRQELPPASGPDFVEQSEFQQVKAAFVPEPTVKEAYQNGLAEGEQRGREAVLKELQPVIEEFRAVILSLAQARKQRLNDVEGELTQIAKEIAKRILHGELQQENDVVIRLARTCIEECQDEGPLVLHVNPADVDLIRTHVPELEAELADEALRIEPDPAIQAGCVVLETSVRCYDGRPERILNAVDISEAAATDTDTTAGEESQAGVLSEEPEEAS